MAEDSTAKRVRYFDHQFLTEKDFNEEQAYFLEKHHRHHRGLHLHGIVEGLTVDFDGTGLGVVRVQPGTAIDSEGRELFLPDQATVTAGTLDNGDYYLVLGPWKPRPSDPDSKIQGQNRRWDETPELFLRKAPVQIPLAKVRIRDRKILSMEFTPRVYSGIALPVNGGLGTLRYSQNDNAFLLGESWSDEGGKLKVGALSVGGATTGSQKSLLSVQGGVTIGDTWAESYAAPAGGLLVEGSVGIGTSSPGDQALKVDGPTTIDGTLNVNGTIKAEQLETDGTLNVSKIKAEQLEADGTLNVSKIEAESLQIGDWEISHSGTGLTFKKGGATYVEFAAGAPTLYLADHGWLEKS